MLMQKYLISNQRVVKNIQIIIIIYNNLIKHERKEKPLKAISANINLVNNIEF